MARHPLVDREVLKHVVVVFPEERRHALLCPVLRRGRDREEGLPVFLQRTSRVAVCNRDPPLKFRHDDDLHRVGRKRNKVFRADKLRRLPEVRRRPRDDRFVVGMTFRQIAENRAYDRPPLRGVPFRRELPVERERGFVELLLCRPEIRFGPLHDLFRRNIGFERVGELLPVQPFPETEVPRRAREEVVLHPLAELLERGNGGVLRRFQGVLLLRGPRRPGNKVVQVVPDQADRPLILLYRGLGVDFRRGLQDASRRVKHRGDHHQPPAGAFQPVVQACEIARKERVDRAPRVVVHRVPFVFPERIGLEERELEVRFQYAAVDAVRRAEPAGLDGFQRIEVCGIQRARRGDAGRRTV